MFGRLLTFVIAAPLAITSLPALGQSSDTALSTWSESRAISAAAAAIERADVYVYSTGGLVCSPAVSDDDKVLARGLRQEFLACGCEISPLTLAQWKYARIFNAEIIAYLKKQR
jgi:hypothetical protein